MTGNTSYSIAKLAEAGGVSRRTVRFYVQRELLPPPEGLGRGARYTDEHLARLLQVKEWQERGVSLEEIARRLAHPSDGRADSARARRQHAPAAHHAALSWQMLDAEPGAPGASWFRQPLVAGFELHVASGRRPLTARQLATLARSLTEIVTHGGEEE